MTNHIDLRDFAASGRFFGLGPSSSRDDVISVLGPPDDTGMVSKREPQGTIFVYGGIELHFDDSDRLALIHCDYPNLPPPGSSALSVSAWVLADKLPLPALLSACSDCGIELEHVSDDPVRRYRSSAGVDFLFYDPHDPSRTGLAAVSLAFSDDDR